MKKRIIILFIALALIVAGGLAWSYYYRYFRGVGPAITNPTGDITAILPDSPGGPVNATNMPLKLPSDFSISVYAKNLSGPRVMVIDPAGNLLVSLTKAGNVAVVKDNNHDGVAEETVNILTGLKNPHGLVIRDNKLYVAQEGQVTAYDYDASHSKATNGKKIADLPTGGRHTTRTLLDDDGKLLVSIGSSCDVCNEQDSRRAAVYEMNYDGSEFKPYATGLRNTVFMAKSYVDGKVWGTDMGRDMLGNTTPPDEINIIEQGKDYGFPICYGKNVHDTQFDKNQYIQDPCNNKVPSYIDLPSHVAPLGLAFIPEEGWPEQYWYNLIVAEHGSWNSTEPVGYKLVRVKLNAKGEYLGIEDFISGWLSTNGKTTLGRPTGVLVQPGGLMYVADDKANVIYRIAYKSSESAVPSQNTIIIKNFQEGQKISSPLTVSGSAPGPWFFEGSFPVFITDDKGATVGQGIAKAQGDWMTKNIVEFTATLNFTTSASSGYLVFRKDNPSGLPENDQEYKVKVSF